MRIPLVPKIALCEDPVYRHTFINNMRRLTRLRLNCEYLNARFECNDIVILIYSHYPLNQDAKLSDTKCFTLVTDDFAFKSRG